MAIADIDGLPYSDNSQAKDRGSADIIAEKASCRMAKISYATIGFGDRDVEAALDAIAAAGFSQAEILGQEPHVASPPTGQALADFVKGLRSRGLSVTLHAPLTTNVLGAPEEQWRREKVQVLAGYLRFAAEIGAPQMVVHPVPNPMFVPEPDRPELPELMEKAAQRSLDDLVPVAKQTGVRMMLENLPYRRSYPLKNMSQLRALVDCYPPECVGLVIDTGHAGTAGKDPAEEIRLAGDRLYGTHLQDVDGQEPNDQHWLPTHGALDWDAIRQALADVRYSGPWTFEVLNGRNGETPEELARLTRALARNWGL